MLNNHLLAKFFHLDNESFICQVDCTPRGCFTLVKNFSDAVKKDAWYLGAKRLMVLKNYFSRAFLINRAEFQ
jgi:hypothetical protein